MHVEEHEAPRRLPAPARWVAAIRSRELAKNSEMGRLLRTGSPTGARTWPAPRGWRREVRRGGPRRGRPSRSSGRTPTSRLGNWVRRSSYSSMWWLRVPSISTSWKRTKSGESARRASAEPRMSSRTTSGAFGHRSASAVHEEVEVAVVAPKPRLAVTTVNSSSAETTGAASSAARSVTASAKIVGESLVGDHDVGDVNKGRSQKRAEQCEQNRNYAFGHKRLLRRERNPSGSLYFTRYGPL